MTNAFLNREMLQIVRQFFHIQIFKQEHKHQPEYHYKVLLLNCVLGLRPIFLKILYVLILRLWFLCSEVSIEKEFVDMV